MTLQVRIIAVAGMPEVRPGDDLAALILEAARGQGVGVEDGDVLVVTQKIVSKAEGRLVDLRQVEPSPRARELAAQTGKDARLLEVILRESRRIVRQERGVIICETKHGFVCANAGVDTSNVGGGMVSLLPQNSDQSAERIRAAIQEKGAGISVAVIISDTFGRPWREGHTNVAIGVAGMSPTRDYVGQSDPHGYVLRVSTMAVADELAAAAELVMGKLSRVPVAIVRGFDYQRAEGSARELIRPAEGISSAEAEQGGRAMTDQMLEGVKKLFEEANIGHLATVMPDGSPQVTPLWVDFDGEHILVNTAEGRQKPRNIRRDPRVAISVTREGSPYTHAQVRGRVVEVTREGAEEHIDRLAKKYLGRDRYPWRQPGERRIILKIAPEHVSSMGAG